MAHAAGLRETRGHVVRIGRAVEIRQVAGDASRRESGIHIIFMTLSTGDTDVSARQREWRTGVVERCALPIRH